MLAAVDQPTTYQTSNSLFLLPFGMTVVSQSSHLVAEESRSRRCQYLIVKSYHGPCSVALPRLLDAPHTLIQQERLKSIMLQEYIQRQCTLDLVSPSTDTLPLSPLVTATLIPLAPTHIPHSHLHRLIGTHGRFRRRFGFPFARLAAAFTLARSSSRPDHAR